VLLGVLGLVVNECQSPVFDTLCGQWNDINLDMLT
jgi:hypothetical protein